MGMVLMFVMPILIFTYGFVGIIKDKGVAMAIVGLNLGIVYMLIMLALFLIHFMVISPFL